MADDQTISDGLSGSFIVSADEVPGTTAKVQRVKLTYSADGSETHAQVDADGVLVNLGSNNDVTVTGTVATNATLQAGTAAIGKLAANSGVDIGDVTLNAGTAEIGKLAAGTAEIGKVEISDGTTQAEVTATGTYKALYTALVDSNGDQVNPGPPTIITATTSDLDTAALASGDVMTDTKLSWANAVATSGGTGHILRATAVDESDLGIEFDIIICNDDVTEAAKNAPHSLLVADGVKVIDKITFSSWEDHDNVQTCTVRPSPPIPFDCAVTTLYAIPVTRGAPTYLATDDIKVTLHIMQD